MNDETGYLIASDFRSKIIAIYKYKISDESSDRLTVKYIETIYGEYIESMAKMKTCPKPLKSSQEIIKELFKRGICDRIQ